MPSNVTVLVVDDDLTNRLVLRALLKESGFVSLEAEDGKQAVDVFQNNHIDIVLLDVMMPVMDGYEAAKIIKKTSQSFVPIIFLTAMTDENSLAKCIEAGGDDFLTKPYNHLLLRAKIDSMLRIAKLYRKVEEQNLELNKHNARIEQEVNVAKKVFGNILDHDMRSSGTGLRYSMSPMSVFNGDMILSERNQTNGLDILISDFTGHGLSAAIGSIPVGDVFYTMTKKGFSFTETLSEANNKLVKLLPTQMFMAGALISIDRNNNVAIVVNCGLPDLYLCRDGKIIQTFKSQNIPLGITHQNSDSYTVDMVPLQFGDRIIAATDGIMEAENDAGEFYGKERILKSIEGAKEPETIFDKILNDCADFTQHAEQSDDITVLEICHLETVEYSEQEASLSRNLSAAEWTLAFELDIESLRNFDVLPYIMQGVNGLQSIPNGRSTIHTILTEIYANALDHGLLGLDSSMKDSPDGYMKFYQEKTDRLETYKEGSIHIKLEHRLKPDGGGYLTVYVTDSGEGFDYHQAPGSIKENSGYSGRGISLVTQLCSDVKYLGKGNEIVATYEWK